MLLNSSLLVLSTRSLSLKGTLLSSGAMAFAGLGDALLYPILPIYGESMGFSILFIGVLLSVNRFVRILSNTPIANLVGHFGMKRILIVCSVAAVFTTVTYGLHLGAIVFLVARIVWGLSYSGLKIATLNYAAGAQNKSGLAFGIANGIKAMGAFFALWMGPVFIENLGTQGGLLVIALISSIGVILALILPQNNTRSQGTKVKTKTTFYPGSINLLVFILSIAIDGILVVGLSHMLIGRNVQTTELLVTVSFYLLLKRLFLLIFSFVSGFLTLRIPAIKLFNLSVLLCIIGTFLISVDYFLIGMVLAFLFNAVIVTFSPLIALQNQIEDKNSLQAISGISTWWDLGAATGAFLGIYLIELMGTCHLFLALSAAMILLFINFIIQNAKTNRAII